MHKSGEFICSWCEDSKLLEKRNVTNIQDIHWQMLSLVYVQDRLGYREWIQLDSVVISFLIIRNVFTLMIQLHSRFCLTSKLALIFTLTCLDATKPTNHFFTSGWLLSSAKVYFSFDQVNKMKIFNTLFLRRHEINEGFAFFCKQIIFSKIWLWNFCILILCKLHEQKLDKIMTPSRISKEKQRDGPCCVNSTSKIYSALLPLIHVHT